MSARNEKRVAIGATIELTGVVSSGLGEGAIFTQLDWVLSAFKAKLGFVPHPGTFNLHMAGDEWQHQRERLMSLQGIAIPPTEGNCGAKCFDLSLENRYVGAVIFPEVGNYPHEKFEIVSPIALRESLGVHDGDHVSLQLSLSS